MKVCSFGEIGSFELALTAAPQDEIRIVKASLIGSILENLLLILGMCFLFGGLRFREQVTSAQTASSLRQLTTILDLQQHGHADERVLAELERH